MESDVVQASVLHEEVHHGLVLEHVVLLAGVDFEAAILQQLLVLLLIKVVAWHLMLVGIGAPVISKDARFCHVDSGHDLRSIQIALSAKPLVEADACAPRAYKALLHYFGC